MEEKIEFPGEQYDHIPDIPVNGGLEVSDPDYLEEQLYVDLESIAQSHGSREGARSFLAEQMAKAVSKGFKLHDEDLMEEALKHFGFVDVNQGIGWNAAEYYSQALSLKDEIEEDSLLEEYEGMDVDEIRPRHLDGEELYNDERWEDQMEDLFRQRAEEAFERSSLDESQLEPVVSGYGENYTAFWRKHKIQEEEIQEIEAIDDNDYSDNVLAAMNSILKPILDQEEYPENFGGIQSNKGPLSAAYLVGAEAHDVNWHREIFNMMTNYYSNILRQR